MTDRDKPLDDAFDEREHAFVLQQGISELDYTELLELAATHAAGAPSVLGAPRWRFVGPRNVGGRVISLGQDPVDPKIVYAGSAHGGLWRSIDAGDTWERLGDDEHVFPVGAIGVADAAPNVIYFGTGALGPNYVSGRGLYRATIVGTTGRATIERLIAPDNPAIAPVNATAGAALRYTRVRVDPDDPTRFWAASQTGLWRCECPLASPPAPHFTREFPDYDNKPTVAALASAPNSNGLWPSHCTDLLVAHDPRETDTVPLNGADVPRYLVLYVAVNGAGVFRGRFDRKDGSMSFDSDKLSIPVGTMDFSRVRLALCERQPQHVFAIMAVSRPGLASGAGSLLTQAVDGTGAPIALQYHASNAADGSSPGLQTMLRAGDKLFVRGVGANEPQVVASVLSDTDVTVAVAFATPIPVGGISYFRGAAADHNNSSEVFHSSDNGDSWTKGAQRMAAINALVGQADYDLALEVAPDNPGTVIAGEGEICISSDFGSNWTKILDWVAYDQGDKAQHADQHFVMFDRGDHRRLWVGNDGGLSVARDLRLPVQADGYWRKRSHGIYAGQSQDVSANPALNFMSGCGFQDNGTYVSLGGPTWYHVGGADGGAMAFDLTSVRQMFVTWQGLPSGEGVEQVNAVASDAPQVAGGYDLVTIAAGDLPESIARGHRIRYRWTDLLNGFTTIGPFVGVIEQHPTLAGQFLAGRKGDAFQSTNFGGLWAPLIPAVGPNPAVPLAPGGEVSALAFGPADAHNPVAGSVDGWAGTGFGTLFFTNNAPAGTWVPLATALPFPGPSLRISEIVVHPFDRRMVVVSATGLHGRVFLTYDRGRTWLDITEPVPTSLVVAPATASVGVGEVRAFTAIANYGGTVVNATWRANWSSSNALQATVVSGSGGFVFLTGFGTEGQVTGVAPGSPTITATMIANTPAATASQSVTITAGPQPATPLAVQPRDMIPGSLPPGPIASVIFDPSTAVATAATLYAGTLAGVYALSSVPMVQSLAIQPAGPIAFQTGAAPFQLRCVATFTDGTAVDVTRDVDWSTSAAGVATVSIAAGTEGQVTFVGAGAATISADRGGVPAGTIAINVQAGPAAAPPALPAAPVATSPTIAVAWQRFNTGLPQVLVTDFERIAGTNAIRAGTFGLGVFECVTTGAPVQQLHIRQTIVEDARVYPRTNPPAVVDDPRLPAGVVMLDMAHAFDIRVDAPPYSFFDDVVDGVEMDEQIEVGDPVPTEDNYVYVQVHNTGTTDVANATVHLYAAECDAADVINPVGGPATASPASLDAGAPIADFYGQTNRDPIATSKWKRVDTARLLDNVASDAPRVARFTWAPDVSLAGKNVALLALCEGPPASGDPLPAAPVAATLSAFILAERRAALRVVHVANRPVASLYIRDGIADDTRLGGYPVGGRSPDIMVVNPDIAGTPADAFKDFISRRPNDKLSGSGTNVIYVRIHNRRRFETKAKAKVYAVALDDKSSPATSTATWIELPPGAPFAEVTIPPLGVGYARVELPTPGDPNGAGTNKTYLLLALIKSDDDTDPLPNKDRVSDVDSFWNTVSRFVDSDNAAARAVPWVP